MRRPRHVIAVGATRGIGREFVRIASRRGWNISVIARGDSPHKKVPNLQTADIRDPSAIATALRGAVRAFGRIHGIVFFQRYRGTHDCWREHMEVSVEGIDRTVALAEPLFARTGDKSIVILSSSAASFVAPEQDAAYHASRAAQLGLMRYLAARLGPKGIRVNSISPGTLLKPENRKFFDGHPARRAEACAVSALRRMGTAAEIATATVFLASPEASWITGHDLACDGGASLWWPESLPSVLRRSKPKTRKEG